MFFSFSVYADEMAEKVVDQFKATPMFSTFNKYYPKKTAKFYSDVKEVIEARQPREQVLKISQKFISSILVQSEKSAPDDAQKKKLEKKIWMYKRLYKVDPQYVVAFEENEGDPRKLPRELQQQFAKNSLEIITIMVKSSTQHPVSPPSAKQGGKYLTAVKQKLNIKFGETNVNNALNNDGSIKDKLRADIIIEYYTLIKADKNGGAILRYLASQVG